MTWKACAIFWLLPAPLAALTGPWHRAWPGGRALASWKQDQQLYSLSVHYETLINVATCPAAKFTQCWWQQVTFPAMVLLIAHRLWLRLGGWSSPSRYSCVPAASPASSNNLARPTQTSHKQNVHTCRTKNTVLPHLAISNLHDTGLPAQNHHFGLEEKTR